MSSPADPKIYHIVHVDRLSSIIKDGCLWCDAEIGRRALEGTIIGMPNIKKRRLKSLLASRPGLHVGDCVPFYFCPRSVMLYVISMANHPGLAYRGGQGPIVHLEADLRQTVGWAEENSRRWAFTLSNAGAGYFEDHCNLEELDKIDWSAVKAKNWHGAKQENKQAEFLVELSFPWELVVRIGVQSQEVYRPAQTAVQSAYHRPRVEVIPSWYY